jgi:hypothetical protein
MDLLAVFMAILASMDIWSDVAYLSFLSHNRKGSGMPILLNVFAEPCGDIGSLRSYSNGSTPEHNRQMSFEHVSREATHKAAEIV